jgi:hypothetical protein
MIIQIKKPIFIVGSGRSGTTLLYEIMAWHKDLAWISNYSNRYYTHFPASVFMCNLHRLNIAKKIMGKRFPKPLEGYRLWDWCHPVEDSPNDPPLTEADVSPQVAMQCRKMVADHLKYSLKKRFLNKNTRNSRRIRYLNKIFPDSKFIHIIREGRAVAASLIHVKFWKWLKPWFLKTESNYNFSQDESEKLVIAAHLWMHEVNRVLSDKEKLDESQYHEVRYEDFTRFPVEIMRGVCDFCELKWNKEFEDFIKKKNIANLNYRYKERLSEIQIQSVEEIIQNFARSLNYNAK